MKNDTTLENLDRVRKEAVKAWEIADALEQEAKHNSYRAWKQMLKTDEEYFAEKKKQEN